MLLLYLGNVQCRRVEVIVFYSSRKCRGVTLSAEVENQLSAFARVEKRFDYHQTAVGVKKNWHLAKNENLFVTDLLSALRSGVNPVYAELTAPPTPDTCLTTHGLLSLWAFTAFYFMCVCAHACVCVASESLNFSASWTHCYELFHICFATAAMKCLHTTAAV